MAIQGLDSRNTVSNVVIARQKRMMDGQRKAMRAPANRSRLGILGHSVMFSIGAKHWADHCDIPQDSEIWDDAAQCAAWAEAMDKMRKFYNEAANRKGIKL